MGIRVYSVGETRRCFVHSRYTYIQDLRLIHAGTFLLPFTGTETVRRCQNHSRHHPKQETHVVRVHRDAGAARSTDRRAAATCEYTVSQALEETD
jgi:hypothetical protein